jgi:cytochrome c peroxidase
MVTSVRTRASTVASSLAFVLLLGTTSIANAQLTPPSPNLAGIVKDEQWARILGKALFWDMNAGSDGLACASCHYSAGADSRIVGQINPGQLRLPTKDNKFGAVGDFDGEVIPGAQVGRTASGTLNPNGTYVLKPEDFPYHQLTNKADKESALAYSSNDVVSSSGSYDQKFTRLGLGPTGVDEVCSKPLADVFHAGGRPGRMVEPRNTPTTINAAFNFVNFWDGRANNVFNGVGVFGRRDIAKNPAARIIVRDGILKVKLQALEIPDASLASQAVGPPLSNEEMSCGGRRFVDLARKLLLHRPLELQKVHAADSLFSSAGPKGSLIASNGRGLNRSYLELIMLAFDEKYWSAPGFFEIKPDGRLVLSLAGNAQVEQNFAMFWGLSVMLYESTLISDQSRFDSCNPRVIGGVPTCQGTPTLTEQELQGFRLFNNFGGAACNTCHGAPLFSEAQRTAGSTFTPIERSRIDNPTPQGAALHDRGFFNIGVRPSSSDPGLGGKDPYGDPLSITRMFLRQQDGVTVTDPTNVICDQTTDVAGGGRLIEPGGTPTFGSTYGYRPDGTCAIVGSAERQTVDGAFKTPTLRNIGLTPPYFHYGGYSDLRSVMDFYNRGGSHRSKSKVNASYSGDTSGSGPLGNSAMPAAGPDFGTNIDRFIRPLGLSDADLDAVVAFMLSLSDERVMCDKAPFDHPELRIPNGHSTLDKNKDGRADDVMSLLPATGAGGFGADGRPELCLPNTGNLFDSNLRNRLTPVQ